jgi:hypothetical protein
MCVKKNKQTRVCYTELCLQSMPILWMFAKYAYFMNVCKVCLFYVIQNCVCKVCLFYECLQSMPILWMFAKYAYFMNVCYTELWLQSMPILWMSKTGLNDACLSYSWSD